MIGIRSVRRNESTAAKRTMYFFLSASANPSIPGKTGESGQPQISTAGGAFTDTGIAVLTELTNGWYKAALTQAATDIATGLIVGRVKTTNAMEQPAAFAYEVGGSLDYIGAFFTNKKRLNKITGVITVFDQDGSSTLFTVTPVEVAAQVDMDVS